jgi:hypothetical protein
MAQVGIVVKRKYLVIVGKIRAKAMLNADKANFLD